MPTYKRMIAVLNGTMQGAGEKPDHNFAVAVVILRNMIKRGRGAVLTTRGYVAREADVSERGAGTVIERLVEAGHFDDVTDDPTGRYTHAWAQKSNLRESATVLRLGGTLGTSLPKFSGKETDPTQVFQGDSLRHSSGGTQVCTQGITNFVSNRPGPSDKRPLGSNERGTGNVDSYKGLSVGGSEASPVRQLALLKDFLFTIMPPMPQDEDGRLVRPSPPLNPKQLRTYAYVLDSRRVCYPADLVRDLGMSINKARRAMQTLGEKGVIQRPPDGMGWVAGPLRPADLVDYTPDNAKHQVECVSCGKLTDDYLCAECGNPEVPTDPGPIDDPLNVFEDSEHEDEKRWSQYPAVPGTDGVIGWVQAGSREAEPIRHPSQVPVNYPMLVRPATRDDGATVDLSQVILFNGRTARGRQVCHVSKVNDSIVWDQFWSDAIDESVIYVPQDDDDAGGPLPSLG
ncbi:hypothetical protein [Actinomycetospora sp. CA-053990]|uniref:hypothetical protein n=1 Tax=Actinomycetospora sp. CA-053990 TaxID=3239891 RepID=UPI003D8C6907